MKVARRSLASRAGERHLLGHGFLVRRVPQPEMQMMFFYQGPAGATDPGTDPVTIPTTVENATDLLQRAQAWLVDVGPGLAMRLFVAIAIFVVGRWHAV